MGKKRVIKIHRVLSMLVAIAITVTIVVVVYQKSGLLSYQLSNYVNDHYFGGTPYRFSCGRITVNLAGQASLARPVVRYDDGTSKYEVFRASSIALGIDVFQVVKLRAIVRKLDVNDATLILEKTDTGEYRLPHVRPFEDRLASSTLSPHVEIVSFDLNNLRFIARSPTDTLTASDVNLSGSLDYKERDAHVRITKGHGVIEEKQIPIESLTLKAHGNPGQIVVDQLEVRTARSLAIVSGAYEGGRMNHVQATFNPLDLEELSATGLVDERGQLGGNIVMEGVPDSVTLSGSVTGRGLGLVFNALSFEGLATPDEIHLSRVEGGIYGARVNGDLKYRRAVGSFTFEGVCEALDISEGFVPDEGTPSTNLNGFATVQHDGVQDTWEFQGDMRRSSVQGFESDVMKFRIGYRENEGLRIRDGYMASDGFELQGSGTIGSDNVADMILSLNGDDLSYVAQYLNLPAIGGRADLSGRLLGPVDDFQVNLNGTWQDLAWEFVQIDSSVVSAEARNAPGPDAAATIDIRGRSVDIGGRRFEAPHALIVADEKRVVFQDVSFALGDTFMTGSFFVETEGTRSDVTVSQLRVQMPEQEWINARPGRVLLDGDVVHVDSLIMAADGQEIGGAGRYSVETRMCQFDTWGNGVELALIKEGAKWPFRMSGEGSFEARVKGHIDNPDVVLTARLGVGVIDSLEFDRLSVEAAFDRKGYSLDRFVVEKGSHNVSATGQWEFHDSPWKIARSGFDRDAAAIAPVKLRVQSRLYPLASVFRVLRLKRPVVGAYEGEMSVRNNLGSPEIKLSGVIEPLPDDAYRIPTIATEAEYRSKMLVIRSLHFDDGNTSAGLAGVLPLEMGLGGPFGLVGSGEVSVDIVVESRDLARISEYFDAIAVSGGVLKGRMKITGTSDVPHYVGSLEVDKGTLRLAGTNELYRDIDANLGIEDKRLTLKALSGKTGDGKFTGSGWAEVEGFHLARYQVDVDLENVLVASIPNIESTQNGHLTLKSHVRADGKTVPLIAGRLDVKQGLLTYELAEERTRTPSPVTLPTDNPSWFCDIEVDAPKNVWLRNRDLNIELEGNVIVKKDTQGLYLRGDLTPLRGSYLLYNNKFHVTDGRVDFSTGFSIRPGLYLDAYTPHRRAGQEERRIYLTLAWPPDKPEPTINLSYDSPGYSQADLWAMLGGQVVAGGAETATGAAQNIASSYLERMLNAQMHETTIDVETRPRDDGTGTGVGQALSVALGRYLSPDLYLKYRQELTAGAEKEVQIEYRVSNIMLLRSEILRNSSGISGSSRRQSTDEINFDIRFRWEY